MLVGWLIRWFCWFGGGWVGCLASLGNRVVDREMFAFGRWRFGEACGWTGFGQKDARWTDREIDRVVLLPPLEVLSARSRTGAKSHVGGWLLAPLVYLIERGLLSCDRDWGLGMDL